MRIKTGIDSVEISRIEDALKTAGFAKRVFSEREREYFEAHGMKAQSIAGAWCAKEAFSKALGSGLRYGTGDLCARSIDAATGRIEMEATRLWLSPFPNLRGKRIDVPTCIIDNTVLAVCVLDGEIADSR